jgi:hypothetical protein
MVILGLSMAIRWVYGHGILVFHGFIVINHESGEKFPWLYGHEIAIDESINHVYT